MREKETDREAETEVEVNGSQENLIKDTRNNIRSKARNKGMYIDIAADQHFRVQIYETFKALYFKGTRSRTVIGFSIFANALVGNL